MHYTYRFRFDPTPEQRELLDHHRDTCRQLYNHALNEFKQIPKSAGTLNQRVRQVRDQLTSLKDWWDELNDVYSTVAQAAVMRIEDSIKALSQLKQNGYNVGSLNWKAPRISVVSPTYSLASSSIVRTANPYCRCRNLRIFPSSNTAQFLTPRLSKKSRLRRSQPVNGSLHSPSAIKRLLRNRPTQIDVSGLTLAS